MNNSSAAVKKRPASLVGTLLGEQLKKFYDLIPPSETRDDTMSRGYALKVRQALLKSHPHFMGQLQWFIEYQGHVDNQGEKLKCVGWSPFFGCHEEENYFFDERNRLPHLSCEAFFKSLDYVLEEVRRQYLLEIRQKRKAQSGRSELTPVLYRLYRSEARVVGELFYQSLVGWIEEQVLLAKAVMTPNNFAEAVVTMTKIYWMTHPFKIYLGEEKLAQHYEEVHQHFKEHIALLRGDEDVKGKDPGKNSAGHELSPF